MGDEKLEPPIVRNRGHPVLLSGPALSGLIPDGGGGAALEARPHPHTFS